MSEFFQSTSGFLGAAVLMALHAIFIENTIFTRALGSSTSLFIIRKKFSIFLFGVILTTITTLSAIIVKILNINITMSSEIYYFTPLIYIAVISCVYVISLIAVQYIRYISKPLKKKVISMIHMSAFNCAVLGALLLGSDSNMGWPQFIGFGMGIGIGFALATFLISVSYDYLSSENIPKAFRGFPITLLYIGILSLAFYGLIGHELPF